MDLRIFRFSPHKKIIDIWLIYDFSKIRPLGSPKPSFFNLNKKNLFHPNIWFGPFEYNAKLNFLNWIWVDPIKPPMVTNFTKKSFLNPFLCTSKNQWLDPKVCADLSWLLVFKKWMCPNFKKYWIINVWSWCKKHDRMGKKKMKEEGQLCFFLG